MMNQSLHSQFEIHDSQVIACEKCPRLVEYRQEVARVKRRAYRDVEYWGKPVPGFGDEAARILIVGLAPGAHGSNRTGRMFTGDDSGKFLYGALHRAGFANQPVGLSRDDGLELKDIYITAVGRCAPPDNKPTATELANCQPWLVEEIDLLSNLQGVVALGKIAYDAMVKLLAARGVHLPVQAFSHSCLTEDPRTGFWLMGCYHPSRQNTQTGRLTAEMYDVIWQTVKNKLKDIK
jgi:uracil-DNA glycosylase family 4